MSQITKRALAASLKKLVEQKPLQKITVADITEDCGVNRHTFYYHFRDIYDLVEWIYQNEAAAALDGKKTYDTWQQGFYQLFEYALSNKKFILGTFRSINKEHLLKYLYGQTYALLIGVLEEQAKGMAVSDQHKAFIANFYAYAFEGIVLRWIDGGMKEDPGAIIETLTVLIRGDFAEALERFQEN